MSLWPAVMSGLAVGAVYALIALGYNVVFSATGILNFAHGEFFMVGTMIGAYLFVDVGLNPILAVILVALLAGLLGVVEERVAVRPAMGDGRGAKSLGWVLPTLGASILIRSVIALIFGPELKRFPPILPDKVWKIGEAYLTSTQLSLIVLAVAAGFGLHLLYDKTDLGRALSAVSQDADAARLRGLPIAALTAIAFALGSGLAAVAGFFAAPFVTASPFTGLVFGLKGFVAAAIGGIPDLRGALLGGLALGVVESVGADIFGGGYRDSVVFAALIVVLLVKPNGLLGRGEVRAV